MPAPATAAISATPAEILIDHLGIEQRLTAEVRDLYSRPIPAPIPPALRRAA